MVSAYGQCRPIGCFDGDVPIAKADGSYEPAKNIQSGDLLLNPLTGAAQSVKRVAVGRENKKPMYEVTIHQRVIKVSSLHPFAIIDEKGQRQWRSAEQLRGGDRVEMQSEINNGQQLEIFAIDKVRPLPISANQVVYNFELEADNGEPENHALLANGYVTGDLFLQQKMELKQDIKEIRVRNISDPKLIQKLIQEQERAQQRPSH
jgi:hypothetical protein